MNEAIKMQVSAFVDGELPENEAELLLRRLSQDSVLRQQVAEYLAIGRAMRGDVQIAGIDELRDRVSAALGEKPVQDEISELALKDDTLVRPMVGFAIAATVALAAIFGLRQLSDIDNPEIAPVTTAQEAASARPLPAEPSVDDVLRQYRMMHDVSVLERGANSADIRFASFEFTQEYGEELSPETGDAAARETDDETETERDAADNTSSK